MDKDFHTFRTDIAEKYGIAEALLLQYLRYWCFVNEANGRNCFDGRAWTYNTRKGFTTIFPYLSYEQIRRVLKKLEKEGLIVSGNYNKSNIDRTLWYSVTEKGNALFNETQANEPQTEEETPNCEEPQMQFAETQNAICKNENSICANPQMQVCKSTNATVQKHKCICANPQTNTNYKPIIEPIIETVTRESEGTRTRKKSDPKKLYGEFVKLTDAEYQKLLNKHGQECVGWMIETLNQYIGERKGKYDRDHYYVMSGGWCYKKWLEEHTAKPIQRNVQNAKNDVQSSIAEVQRRIKERFANDEQGG